MSLPQNHVRTHPTSRRDFLKGSAILTGSAMAAGLPLSRGAHAAGSDTLKVGLIGCGGRGSGAASIVSYCLFITQVDPIRYTLRFERFIHPEREDMPDIDVDFPWDERDDILEYIFNKYGPERSAMVSNQVFLRTRSAIREVAKVYGLSNEEIRSITKRVGYYQKRRDLERWVSTDPRFANTNLDDTLRDVLRQSEKIIDVFRNSSAHPGGVIIVPDEIRKYVPVLRAPKGVQIVEWEKDQVEDSGLLKIDILGNRSLAVARDTIRQINLNYGTAASTNKYLGESSLILFTNSLFSNLSGETNNIFNLPNVIFCITFSYSL